MTLSTDIYILDPIDPSAVFTFCQELMGDPEDMAVEESESWASPGARVLMNAPGQGLPAWLMVFHRSGAPLVTEDSARTCTEDCDPDRGDHPHPVPAYLTVNFDTGYRYKDEHGGCTELHIRYIVALGRWLNSQGVGWRWRDEYCGDIYDGLDLEGLKHFASDGKQAHDWFTNVVQPAIEVEHPDVTWV